MSSNSPSDLSPSAPQSKVVWEVLEGKHLEGRTSNRVRWGWHEAQDTTSATEGKLSGF